MKFVGLILLIAIGYIIWRFAVRGDGLVLIGADTGKRVTASLIEIIPNESLVLQIDNNDKTNFVTVISMPRQLAETLGANPPEGFLAEPMPLSESERKDKETVDYAKEYDAQTLRWAGRLLLTPNEPTEFKIPAKNTSDVSGRIDFQYEAKVGFGGAISFFSLSLDSPPENDSHTAILVRNLRPLNEDCPATRNRPQVDMRDSLRVTFHPVPDIT